MDIRPGYVAFNGYTFTPADAAAYNRACEETARAVRLAGDTPSPLAQAAIERARDNQNRVFKAIIYPTTRSSTPAPAVYHVLEIDTCGLVPGEKPAALVRGSHAVRAKANNQAATLNASRKPWECKRYIVQPHSLAVTQFDLSA